MNYNFAGSSNMARSTYPIFVHGRTISQPCVPTSRTILFIIPLRHKRELVGTLIARRTEVRGRFTPGQMKLLETFADQAVIAIENVCLFQELKESLEQQTATSEILSVIASSPTDVQPVLNAVAEKCCPTLRCATMLSRPLSKATKHRRVASCGTLSPPPLDFQTNLAS